MTKLSLRLILIAFPAALFTMTIPADAQVVYSSRSAFDTVNPGLTSFNFDNIAAIDGFADYSGENNTLALNGVSFSNPVKNGNATLSVINSGYYGSVGSPDYALGNSDFLQVAGASPTTLNVALPSNTTAFGADFGTFENPGQVQVIVNGQALAALLITTDSNTGSFFGYTSLTPITTLSFVRQGSAALNANNVEFGSAAAVPEVSSALSLSLLIGIGGAACIGRRKKAV